MSHVGDYQSLFQLAAAVSVGMLALDTLLEAPVQQKKPEFQLLLIQVKGLLADKKGPGFEGAREDIDNLAAQLQTSIDTNLITEKNKNNWASSTLKACGIIFSFISIGFLYHNSNNYSLNSKDYYSLLAILLLVVPLLLTIGLLYISSRALEALEKKRAGFEVRFLELVDACWELKLSDYPGRTS